MLPYPLTRRDELQMLTESSVYRQRAFPSGTTLHRFKSKSGNTIAAFYIQCGSSAPRYTFLFSHANAVDIGQVCSKGHAGTRFGVTISAIRN